MTGEWETTAKKKVTDLHDMSISMAGHVNQSQEGLLPATPLTFSTTTDSSFLSLSLPIRFTSLFFSDNLHFVKNDNSNVG